MSGDFIEDASDALEKSGANYVLLAAFPSSPNCYKTCNVPSRDHLEWMKRRFAEMCDSLEKQYNEREGSE